ncbi:Glutamate receptor ionotropic, delta-2-like 27 [Homarus americanus]|uniref:Glutamate receptor ionotropic, delta-2-like 27 n=1 Tax=Homarus americanus TaxID=6706 RepID=A0A8J5JD77_HOMAM|nr:Glutamate receptor ionotropic, delta-2-like 27 [Homarus americanus]
MRQSSPTLRVVESAGDGGPHLVGFLAEVMAFLQQSLHFRYNVSQVRGYGTRLINGSWIGLVGAVAEKQVEVGLSSLSITYERRQVVSFTSHLLESSVYLMFPAKHILKPIFVVFLIFTPLRSTITLNTNTSTSPSSPSSGNLTAFLSIPRLQQYPSTPEEMLQQGYAPLLTKGFSHYDNFKYSRLDTFQKLFRVAQERGSIYPFGRVDHNTVMDRFSESPVASIISALGVVYRQNSGAGPNQPCAFYVEPEPLSSQLIWLRDMGVLKRASQKHNAIHCLGGGGMGDGVDGGGSVSGGSLPLSLTDLQGAFLLWVAGTVLSLLFLLVEVVVVRCVGGDRSGVSC